MRACDWRSEMDDEVVRKPVVFMWGCGGCGSCCVMERGMHMAGRAGGRAEARSCLGVTSQLLKPQLVWTSDSERAFLGKAETLLGRRVRWRKLWGSCRCECSDGCGLSTRSNLSFKRSPHEVAWLAVALLQYLAGSQS